MWLACLRSSKLVQQKYETSTAANTTSSRSTAVARTEAEQERTKKRRKKGVGGASPLQKQKTICRMGFLFSGCCLCCCWCCLYSVSFFISFVFVCCCCCRCRGSYFSVLCWSENTLLIFQDKYSSLVKSRWFLSLLLFLVVFSLISVWLVAVWVLSIYSMLRNLKISSKFMPPEHEKQWWNRCILPHVVGCFWLSIVHWVDYDSVAVGFLVLVFSSKKQNGPS